MYSHLQNDYIKLDFFFVFVIIRIRLVEKIIFKKSVRKDV
jgi:hypothetical protein